MYIQGWVQFCKVFVKCLDLWFSIYIETLEYKSKNKGILDLELFLRKGKKMNKSKWTWIGLNRNIREKILSV